MIGKLVVKDLVWMWNETCGLILDACVWREEKYNISLALRTLFYWQ
jgi:hypothetical protein